jgi:hypothetical protein
MLPTMWQVHCDPQIALEFKYLLIYRLNLLLQAFKHVPILKLCLRHGLSEGRSLFGRPLTMIEIMHRGRMRIVQGGNITLCPWGGLQSRLLLMALPILEGGKEHQGEVICR